MPITTNPQLDLGTNSGIKIYYLDDGCAIFRCLASPEGLITARAGSFAVDLAGNWYRKTTDTGATGWTPTSPPGASSPIGVLTTNTSVVGTVGAVETQLHVYGIPANTFNVDGRAMRWTLSGTFAANGNSKLILARIGGTNAISVAQPFNNLGWRIKVEMVRASSSTLRVIAVFQAGNNFVTTLDADSNNVLVSGLDFTNTIFIQGRGQGTSNDDVQQNLTLIDVG